MPVVSNQVAHVTPGPFVQGPVDGPAGRRVTPARALAHGRSARVLQEIFQSAVRLVLEDGAAAHRVPWISGFLRKAGSDAVLHLLQMHFHRVDNVSQVRIANAPWPEGELAVLCVRLVLTVVLAARHALPANRASAQVLMPLREFIRYVLTGRDAQGEPEAIHLREVKATKVRLCP